jgi:hypothetical protein
MINIIHYRTKSKMFPLDFHFYHKTTNRYVFRNSTFFNERIMMAIVQEDENSNTSRGRVVELSD